ncbi:Golgi apparatus membrane protein tvp38 [Choanephora cucurbitarum]|uniref:Golgi apparatus membrane protein TVP38 n=1 Tax=Choanephora cucurbitarum TaxID=101091 RepID=A0A1C7N5B7_9FUNG|nr:Golgi apparatus membrane protein tvp38 [Choanephora cucurbitarum]
MAATFGQHEDSTLQNYANIELSRLSLQQQEHLLVEDDQDARLYLKPPSRWERWRQQFTKEKLKALAYEKRWSLIFIGISILLGIISYHYRREFFETLEYISQQLVAMGFGYEYFREEKSEQTANMLRTDRGYVLMASLIFLSSFPPIMGYATYQTLSGFTYGFGVGFFISYVSALAGGVVCFQLSRTCLGEHRIRKLMDKSHSLKSLIKAVDKKGFNLFLLIRFSPYPFNLMNVLFAITHITLPQFVIGTGISLIKIGLHVYVGANLTSFAKHLLGEDKDDMTEGELRAEKVKFFGAIALSSLAFVVLIYVFYVAKQAVKEEEEQMAFLGHHDEEEGFLDDSEQEEEEVVRNDNDGMSLDNWDAWDEQAVNQAFTDSNIKKGLGKND